MLNKNLNTKAGFTLIEVLIVIGILAILAGIVLVAINPGRQFAQARDTQRASAVHAILNAIGQNMAENRGTLDCENVEIPEGEEQAKEISSDSESGVDLYDCLVPNYLAELPVDPEEGAMNKNTGEYDTGYQIFKSAGDRITITAPHAELDDISVTR